MEVRAEKNWLVMSLLLLITPTGILGGYIFYLKGVKAGLIRVVTLNGFGIWYIYDSIMWLLGKLEDADGNKVTLKGWREK